MFRIIKARRRLKPCPFCGGKAKLDKNAFLPFCRSSKTDAPDVANVLAIANDLVKRVLYYYPGLKELFNQAVAAGFVELEKQEADE